jgi:hypothetical protein
MPTGGGIVPSTLESSRVHQRKDRDPCIGVIIVNRFPPMKNM